MRVALSVSVPDTVWPPVPLYEVTVLVTVNVPPGGTGILAWVLGVIQIERVLVVVVAVRPETEMEKVFEVGFVDEP